MVTNDAESWNIRYRHMMQTLERLLEFHGSESKAIVWAYNTHIGDARYTDMAAGGMINIGQLAREKVWRRKRIRRWLRLVRGIGNRFRWLGWPNHRYGHARGNCRKLEQILHELSPQNKLVFFKDIADVEYLKDPIGHRAVGVVYNPALEHFGNYVPTIIPKRDDAFLYFDQTQALHPAEASRMSRQIFKGGLNSLLCLQ